MEGKFCFGCMRPKIHSPVCEHCGFDERQQNEIHQLPVGSVLKGQYIVGRVLGQGGFGITYMGFDRYLSKQVAIKEYYPTGLVMRDTTHSIQVTNCEGQTGTTFESNLRRFLREAQSLAKLADVPEVVHVSNYFPENGTAYIIMEFIQGVTLKDYIRKSGLMSPAQAMAVFRPVMEGLQKVHEVGLVHRDISPDNIMILPNGNVKILDFGAVRDYANQELSQSTQAILKPGFAPVEQYRAMSELGPYTDLYALCATMYYCMCGKLPPEAPERMMEGAEFQWGRIQGLKDHELAALKKGTAILAKDRYQSVAAFRDDILGITKVTTVTRKPGIGKWIAIGLVLAVAVGAGALLLGKSGSDKAPESSAAMEVPATEALAILPEDDPLVMENTYPPHSVVCYEYAEGSDNYYFWKEVTGDTVTFTGPGLDITITGKTITATVSGLSLKEEYPVDRSETEAMDTELEWELDMGSMFENYRFETSYYTKNPGANRKLKPEDMYHNAMFSPDGSGYKFLASIPKENVVFTEDSITWTLAVPDKVPMSTYTTQLDAAAFHTFHLYMRDTLTGFSFSRFYHPAPEGLEPGEFPVVKGMDHTPGMGTYESHTEHTYRREVSETATVIRGENLTLTQADRRDITIQLENVFMAGGYMLEAYGMPQGTEAPIWEVSFKQGDRRFRFFIRHVCDGSEGNTLEPASKLECGFTVTEGETTVAQGTAFFASDGTNLTLYARLPWAVAQELDLEQVESYSFHSFQSDFGIFDTRFYEEE